MRHSSWVFRVAATRRRTRRAIAADGTKQPTMESNAAATAPMPPEPPPRHWTATSEADPPHSPDPPPLPPLPHPPNRRPPLPPLPRSHLPTNERVILTKASSATRGYPRRAAPNSQPLDVCFFPARRRRHDVVCRASRVSVIRSLREPKSEEQRASRRRGTPVFPQLQVCMFTTVGRPGRIALAPESMRVRGRPATHSGGGGGGTSPESRHTSRTHAAPGQSPTAVLLRGSRPRGVPAVRRRSLAPLS